MSSIELRLRDAQELRDLWLDGLDNGGVFVEGSFLFTAGAPIRVRVTVDSPASTTVLDGTVIYRRMARGSAASKSLRSGIGIEFSSTARPSIEFLSRLAHGTAADGREHVRYPTAVDGDLLPRIGETTPARLVDVAVRGARVVLSTPTELPSEMLVELRLPSPTMVTASLYGRVVWSRGDSLGVRLVFSNGAERLHWAKIVTRARSDDQFSPRAMRVAPLDPSPIWEDETPPAVS